DVPSRSYFPRSGSRLLLDGRRHPLDGRRVRGNVAELVPPRAQIGDVVLARLDVDRLAAGDPQAVALEADDLARVVRQQADRAQSEIEQNLCADAVVAQVRLEAERLVRLHRVLPLVLQRIRADLVRQPDAAAFLPQVHDRALS